MNTGPSEASSTDDELKALGRLTGDALGGLVDTVEAVHRDIATRVADALPPVTRPVTGLQSAATRATYAVVAGASRVVPRVAAEALSASGRSDQAAPSASAGGRQFLAVTNGLWADHVQAYPALVVDMQVRHDGQSVATDPAALAATFPSTAAGLAVFVHGLAESDETWHPGADAAWEAHGVRLTRDHGFTSVYVRYNSGLSVAQNGASLAALLTEVVASWPTPVTSLVLVGHSMGGLVIEEACRVAVDGVGPWLPLLRLVVALGTPHQGAALADGVRLASDLLAIMPVAAPIARVVSIRSDGIHDLMHDAPRPLPSWTSHPELAHIRFCTVAGTLTQSPSHPVGWALGDGLVRVPSANAHPPVSTAGDAHHVGGVGHQQLMASDAVYQQVSLWVTETRD